MRNIWSSSSSSKKKVSDSRRRTRLEEERAGKTDETEKEKRKWKDLRITGRHGLTCVSCAELWDCAILQIYEIEEGCCCKGQKKRHSEKLWQDIHWCFTITKAEELPMKAVLWHHSHSMKSVQKRSKLIMVPHKMPHFSRKSQHALW